MTAGTSRPLWIGAVEWSALLGFVTLWLVLAARLAQSGPGGDLWLLPVAFALGFLAGDFFSGLVHWFCDSVFEEETPLIGPLLIHPFRDHHRDPLAMTRHAFVEITGNSCLALAPLLAITGWLLPAPGAGAPVARLALATILAFSFATFWVNQVHKWAHMPVPPDAVARLQRGGLILAPRRHALHHRRGGRAYCVLTGWMNRPLDAIGFFAGVERAMALAGFRWFSRGREWDGLPAPEELKSSGGTARGRGR
ncbi:MAG TPA: fatty acid desaturase CarF family protein [Candidatus Limnocylindrales bacterium]|nr:fatty acid desaturase CarF family protein [Candidatus Limnocylindrales bacterium]